MVTKSEPPGNLGHAAEYQPTVPSTRHTESGTVWSVEAPGIHLLVRQSPSRQKGTP